MPLLRSINSRWPWVMWVVFAVIYALIWVPNHLLLRTYALDLGLYTHALWQYIHGRVADTALFLDHQHPLLADHFDLYLPLLSPLVMVFGSWTLLIVQWLAMLAGAWGVRHVLLLLGTSARGSTIAMLVMLLYFGMFTAVAFDYHSNVVAAMLLPWWLAAVLRQRPWQALALWVLILVGKENMGLWMGWLALVTVIAAPIPDGMRRWVLASALIGWAWSVIVISWVMPALSTTGDYAHFDYRLLGEGIGSGLHAFMDRPGQLFLALFTDHVGTPKGTAIKIEFWVLWLVAGGWAMIMRPVWMLMALPLLAQKMWHDDPGKWSVVAHYSAEFAPLIGIAIGRVLQRWPKPVIRVVVVVGALVATVRCMDNTVAHQDRSRIRLYQAQHWTKPYALDPVRAALDRIPADAALSAQSPAVPHAIERTHLYQFPIIGAADHILLLPQESPYPLDPSAYRLEVERLRHAAEWTVVIDAPEVILLHRR